MAQPLANPLVLITLSGGDKSTALPSIVHTELRRETSQSSVSMEALPQTLRSQAELEKASG